MSEQIEISANGLKFAALADGPAGGPLALCLHGFPDSAHTWRHLLPELAAAGFRAVAPWLRGYAPTGLAPDGRYHLAAGIADVDALHDALAGGEDAVLIGHDWGAPISYGAAAFSPHKWRRLVTHAVPPSGRFMSELFKYDQIKRSFYMFVFQMPYAEMIVGADDLLFIDRLWADWSPGYDASADLPGVKAALGTAENVTAALGYYRATLGLQDPGTDLAAQAAALGSVPPQPCLYLHGAQDGCAGVEMAYGAEEFMAPGSRVEVIDGAGHFLHLEKPSEVNKLILDWVTP